MDLSWVTLVWSSIAASCLTVGLLYAGIWFKQSQDHSHLLFSIVAACVAAIAVGELMLMRSVTPEAFGAVLRWLHVPIFALVVGTVIFVRLYLGFGNLWLGGAACVVRLLALVLNFYFEPNLNYSAIIGLAQVAMPGGETVAVPVGTPNPATHVGELSSLLVLVYLIHASVEAWRHGAPGKRQNAALVGGSFAIFAAIAAGHAAMLHAGWIRSPYFVSLPFSLVIMAMGYKLVADVAATMRATARLKESEAELQRNRRRIESAAAAAQTAIWEWDVASDSVWITDQGRVLFGIGSDEHVSLKRFQATLHPDDRERVTVAVTESLEKAEIFEREYRIVPAPGRVRWITTRGTVDTGPDGRPLRMRGLSLDVTERKRNQESMGLLAAIVESSSEAIIAVDLHGIVSSWNAGAEKIFGFAAEEMVGRPLSRIAPDGHRREEEDLLQRVLRGEGVEQYETVLSRKDGSLISVSVSPSAIRSSTGRIIAASTIIRDISERKRADAALRESESRFRAMADSAPVMIWMAGRDKLFTFFNSAWLKFTGRRFEREVGDGWFEGIHPDDLTDCIQRFGRAFEARETFTMEYRLRRADREYRWMVDTGAPRILPDGTFLGFVGSCIDITERKLSADLLRKERAFLRQVIDVDPNLIFAKDRAGRFTLVNQAVAGLFGTTVENIVGKTDAELNPNAAEVEHFRHVDLQVMDSRTEHFVPEETLTAASGKVVWLQTVKRPLLDENGIATQVLGSATDITQRKRAEFELAAQRNELAHLARVAMLGELSGSLAHELNQPLMAILANAQAAQRFLARKDVDLDEVREILQDIVNDDKRAGEVITGLRLLLKKGEMVRQPLDINQVANEVLRLVRSDLLNTSVIVNLELTPGLPPAFADRVQVQQVLINLVVNACEAMSAADPTSRQLIVRTSLAIDGDVWVSVSDMGPGIPAQNFDHVFDPFFTTKPHGLGLGLAVCRTIIGTQGGRLWATNNTTRGATFHFTLPVALMETVL